MYTVNRQNPWCWMGNYAIRIIFSWPHSQREKEKTKKKEEKEKKQKKKKKEKDKEKERIYPPYIPPRGRSASPPLARMRAWSNYLQSSISYRVTSKHQSNLRSWECEARVNTPWGTSKSLQRGTVSANPKLTLPQKKQRFCHTSRFKLWLRSKA